MDSLIPPSIDPEPRIMNLTISPEYGESTLNSINNKSFDPVKALFKLSWSSQPPIKDIEFHKPTCIPHADPEEDIWQAVLTAILIPEKKSMPLTNATLRATASSDADATLTVAGAMLGFMWNEKLLDRYYMNIPRTMKYIDMADIWPPSSRDSWRMKMFISELKEGRPESEIQKQDEDTETSIEFMVIWRRANRNPMEVLRIIERENSGHRMRHWANAVRMVQDRKV